MKIIQAFIFAFIFLPVMALAQHNWLLSAGGLGPIKIGMTVKQIEAVTQQPLDKTSPDPSREDKSCFITSFKTKSLQGISMMIANGKLARINISSTNYPTTTGVRIGDTEDDVKNHYDNQIEVSKHQYDTNGHYLTYLQKQKKRGIRFETNGKTVTLIYSGLRPQLYFVEDCV